MPEGHGFLMKDEKQDDDDNDNVSTSVAIFGEQFLAKECTHFSSLCSGWQEDNVGQLVFTPFDQLIARNNGWISIKFVTNIQGSQIMIPHEFVDPLTFPTFCHKKFPVAFLPTPT